MTEKIRKDNEMSVELTNGSFVKAVPSSGDAGRSESLSLLVLDECLTYDNKIKIKNKNTGEIKEVNIGELYLNNYYK